MKRSRFSEEQIVKIIKEGAAGVPLDDLTRQHGISNAMRSSFKLRSLQPALPRESATPREHVLQVLEEAKNRLLEL